MPGAATFGDNRRFSSPERMMTVKRHWEIDELVENFMLRPEELALLSGSSPSSHMGMAVLMKFFQHEARFPHKPSEVPEEVVTFIAQQLGLNASDFKDYRW